MRKRDLIALSAIAYFTFSGSAFAYLDPGTGSIILQALAARYLTDDTAFRLEVLPRQADVQGVPPGR